VYGLRVESARPWPGLTPAGAENPGAPRVTIVPGAEPELRARFSGARDPGRTLATGDGPVLSLRGHARDMLLDAGEVGVFHLSADGSLLRYASPDPDAPGFARMLTDTALGTAALLCGHEGLHAAAVAIEGRAVAIAAGTGSGKTSLAVAALRRGAALITDDLLFLSATADAVLAHAGPALLNLPEGTSARGLGEVVATLGREQWVEVTRSTEMAPAHLALVVLLDREPGAGDPHAADERSPAALIAHGLDSGRAPERQAKRLALLARVAQATPIVRLRAGTEVGADTLGRVLVELAGSRG
jgi:hypothetical protein